MYVVMTNVPLIPIPGPPAGRWPFGRFGRSRRSVRRFGVRRPVAVRSDAAIGRVARVAGRRLAGWVVGAATAAAGGAESVVVVGGRGGPVFGVCPADSRPAALSARRLGASCAATGGAERWCAAHGTADAQDLDGDTVPNTVRPARRHSMIELNLRSTPARVRKPPQRYFGAKGVEATVSEVSSEQQRKQYAWALANSSGPGTPAPFGFNAKGKPIKKKRKKTRSKQKNLKKDNRPEELKPVLQAAREATGEAAALPPLEALLLQLHRENPQHGAKRLTRLVRAHSPELANGTKEVRKALARVLSTKRSPKGAAKSAESRHAGDVGVEDERLPGAEDAAAVDASIAKAVAAAEVWAREHSSSSSSGSDDDLERKIVAAADSFGDRTQGTSGGHGSDGDSTSGWWSCGDFRAGGPDHYDCRLPPAPRSRHACFCCVCGGSGHTRLECSAAPTEMPAANQDYVKTPAGGQRHRKRSGDILGQKRKRRPNLWEQIQEAAHIPSAATRRQRSTSGSSNPQQRGVPRQKNGKLRDEGPRPKGGWAPKRTVFGKKKTSSKQPRNVDGGKCSSVPSRKERRAARAGRSSSGSTSKNKRRR